MEPMKTGLIKSFSQNVGECDDEDDHDDWSHDAFDLGCGLILDGVDE
jgi:hypothetical protein